MVTFWETIRPQVFVPFFYNLLANKKENYWLIIIKNMRSFLNGFFIFCLSTVSCVGEWDHAPQENVHRSLDQAVRNGDVALVRSLLKRWASLTYAFDGLYPPLHTAAYFGHIPVVDVLLEAGALIESKDMQGGTPLHAAALANQQAMVQFLQSRGASINAKNNKGQTPFHLAVLSADVEIVHFLFEAGAMLDARDSEGNTSLHTAAESNNTFEVLEFLYAHKVDIDGLNKAWESPLMLAIKTGKMDKARWLLQHGANPLLSDDWGYFPYDYLLPWAEDDYLDQALKGPTLEAKRTLCLGGTPPLRGPWQSLTRSSWETYCTALKNKGDPTFCQEWLIATGKDSPGAYYLKAILRLATHCSGLRFVAKCQGLVDAAELEARDAEETAL